MLDSSIWAGQVTPSSDQLKATKEEEEEDDDGGPVDNEDIIGEVKLAQRSSASPSLLFASTLFILS
jgi:hypothetical protein